MKDSMNKHLYYILLLTTVLMAACTQVDAPVSDDSQTPQMAADPGQGYTDKTLPVTRDKQSEGQIRLRYYSDMPSVAYVSVADFHKLMSKGQTMTVTNQDGVYTLAAGKGTATVDVRQDVFTSTTYAELISLSHLTAPGLPPNAGCYDVFFEGWRVTFAKMLHTVNFLMHTEKCLWPFCLNFAPDIK